jgi:hypothetical protein
MSPEGGRSDRPFLRLSPYQRLTKTNYASKLKVVLLFLSGGDAMKNRFWSWVFIFAAALLSMFPSQ